MKEITITGVQEGQRLDRFLSRYLPGASSGFLHKMLRKKNIKLNAAKAEGSEKLKKGDKVQIFFSDETLEKFMGSGHPAEEETKKLKDSKTAPKTPRLTRDQMELRKKVKVIYRSDDIIVFHKPAGMLTQKAEKGDDSLNDYLIHYCVKNHLISEEELQSFRPAACNRLDRNTSGMVLCGITIRGLQTLSTLLRNRDVKKYYFCIVKGKMQPKKGKIRGYLSKDDKTNVVTISKERSEGASYIATDYEVMKDSNQASLLKIDLITGKSHQIRAHLASIGHPVAGDYKYGDRNWNNSLKWDQHISYQMLHNCEICFPDTDAMDALGLRGLHLTDPEPEEFRKAGKYYDLWEHGIQEG